MKHRAGVSIAVGLRRAVWGLGFLGFLVVHAAAEAYGLLYHHPVVWALVPVLTLAFYGYVLFSPTVRRPVAIGLSVAISLLLSSLMLMIILSSLTDDPETAAQGLGMFLFYFAVSNLLCFIGASFVAGLRQSMARSRPAPDDPATTKV